MVAEVTAPYEEAQGGEPEAEHCRHTRLASPLRRLEDEEGRSTKEDDADGKAEECVDEQGDAERDGNARVAAKDGVVPRPDVCEQQGGGAEQQQQCPEHGEEKKRGRLARRQAVMLQPHARDDASFAAEYLGRVERTQEADWHACRDDPGGHEAHGCIDDPDHAEPPGEEFGVRSQHCHRDQLTEEHEINVRERHGPAVTSRKVC